jgi:hypothetical protein
MAICIGLLARLNLRDAPVVALLNVLVALPEGRP